MARQIINLESWKFHLGFVSDGWYRGGNEDSFENVRVPHDWAISRGFSEENSSGTGYVCGGEGWYRTRFSLKPQKGQHVKITFLGVYNNSKVWCNSNYLGKRPYGYSTFTYDITEFLAEDGDNEISVQVLHPETADSRWYTGSGIVRPVFVTVTGEPYVDTFGVSVVSRNVSDKSAELEIKTSLVGSGSVKSTVISPSGDEILSLVGTDVTGIVTSPSLWSEFSPALYTLKTEALDEDGNVTDSVTTKFGIRSLRFDPDHGFFCNGVSTKLRGVCVHHDAGTLGAAVPKEVWRRRLEILRSCGTNAIRTSHNPPDPDLLDLCDEMGFYVMDEAFDEWEAPKNKWWQGHNVRPPKLNGYYEDFIEWGECDIKTMVLRDRNHPSIIMWSIGNEVDYPNDPYVYSGFDIMTGNNDAGKSEAERRYDINRPDSRRLEKIAKRLVGWVKDVDTTRPVTAALAYPEMSVRIGYMQALDIAGYNYKEQFYDAHHKEFPNAFIYGSENSHGPEQWEVVRDNDYICGQFLWTGIDYLGEAHGWPIRASGAGLIDLAGFPSQKFYQRRTMWCDTLQGYLHVFRPRKDGQRERRFGPTEPTVFVMTNADECELFAGKRSLGRVKAEHFMCRFDISSEAEDTEYKAIIYRDGQQLDIFGEKNGAPAKLTAIPWGAYVNGDGAFAISDSVCQLEIRLLDENGVIAAHGEGCSPDVFVSVDGAELLGIENGNIADLTGYGEAHRRIHNGHMIAYVRGTRGSKAAITLNVPENDALSKTVDVVFE